MHSRLIICITFIDFVLHKRYFNFASGQNSQLAKEYKGAAAMKGRGRGDSNTRRARKDRVLQARIPSHLDEQLRDRAEQLGLSVSTVVRNVLLHTFDLVEGVVADSAEIARVIQRRQVRPPGLTREEQLEDEVLGWQEAVLNRNGVCQQCNAILAKGKRAAIGLPARGEPPLLCLTCLEALTEDDDQDAG